MKLDREGLSQLLQRYPQVALLYLFGSQTSGRKGPVSDFDFAVYLDETDKGRMFDIKLALTAELSRLVNSDAVDVIVLNLTPQPELKYDVISQGQLLFEREPFRVLVEPRILNDYFDFRQILRRYGLTRA